MPKVDWLWVRPVETAWGHPLIDRFSCNHGQAIALVLQLTRTVNTEQRHKLTRLLV